MDESIMEVMSLEEMPWKHNHHRYSFLTPCHVVEEHFALVVYSDVVTDPQSPILTHDVEHEGNIWNITKTMTMNISIKPGILENIQIGHNSSPFEVRLYTNLFKEFWGFFTSTYEEIPWIDPSIIVHEIKTYPRAKPVFQKLCQVHPRRRKLKKF